MILLFRFPSLIGRLKTGWIIDPVAKKDLFPSLIGRLKTNIEPNARLLPRRVSIPHRKTKNAICPQTGQVREVVSIPHRKTKNQHTISYNIFDRILFPSLIGRLKTCGDEIKTYAPCLFPSLIGRLKTAVLFHLSQYSYEFPSLIGRLKTKIAKMLDRLDELFPSLIGRLKTIYNTSSINPHTSVSIPHRKTKNENQFSRYILWDKKFPSLIGRLKTTDGRGSSLQ